MLSCLFRQWGPQPGLPLAGLGHAHIMMSSSCCVFFSLCVKMFADICCHTAGFSLCKGLRKSRSSYNTHDMFCHISITAKDWSTIVREATQQEVPHFPLQVHGQWLRWTSLEGHCSCCSLRPGFLSSTCIRVNEHSVSTNRVAAGQKATRKLTLTITALTKTPGRQLVSAILSANASRTRNSHIAPRMSSACGSRPNLAVSQFEQHFPLASWLRILRAGKLARLHQLQRRCSCSSDGIALRVGVRSQRPCCSSRSLAHVGELSCT